MRMDKKWAKQAHDLLDFTPRQMSKHSNSHKQSDLRMICHTRGLNTLQNFSYDFLRRETCIKIVRLSNVVSLITIC